MIHTRIKEHIRKAYRKVRGKNARPQRYQYLFDTIDALHPTRVFEIGVWNGKRARKMIVRAQEYNPGAVAYYGTDLFESMNEELLKEELSKKPPTEKEVRAFLEKTGADIHLFAGNTLEVLPEITPSLPKMDMIFIDGGHAVGTIANDWQHVSQLMHNDTVVIFDDYYPDREDVGAKLVVGKIDRGKYNVRILDTEDVFSKDNGELRIRFVEVRRKA